MLFFPPCEWSRTSGGSSCPPQPAAPDSPPRRPRSTGRRAEGLQGEQLVARRGPGDRQPLQEAALQRTGSRRSGSREDGNRLGGGDVVGEKDGGGPGKDSLRNRRRAGQVDSVGSVQEELVAARQQAVRGRPGAAFAGRVGERTEPKGERDIVGRRGSARAVHKWATSPDGVIAVIVPVVVTVKVNVGEIVAVIVLVIVGVNVLVKVQVEVGVLVGVEVAC